MRGLDLIAERRPAQDQLRRSQAQEVRQVGMAMGELLNAKSPRNTRQVLPQVPVKPVRRQFFAGADRPCVIEVQTHENLPRTCEVNDRSTIPVYPDEARR